MLYAITLMGLRVSLKQIFEVASKTTLILHVFCVWLAWMKIPAVKVSHLFTYMTAIVVVPASAGVRGRTAAAN